MYGIALYSSSYISLNAWHHDMAALLANIRQKAENSITDFHGQKKTPSSQKKSSLGHIMIWHENFLKCILDALDAEIDALGTWTGGCNNLDFVSLLEW